MASSVSLSLCPSIRRTGITILYQPTTRDDTVLDILFVHGLQGHPRNTWTWTAGSKKTQNLTFVESKPGKPKRGFWRKTKTEGSGSSNAVDDNTSEQSDIYWPYHLLPDDCPNARILTWGYDSDISKFFSGSANKNSIFSHSRDLLEDLSWERRHESKRPIIFVAHSLGGIIIKDLLLRANESNDERHQDLCNSAIATLFLGTPHRGSTYADMGETVRRVASIVGFDTASQNIQALEVDGALLENCDERFQKLCDRLKRHYEVHTFQEAQGMKGTQILSLNEKVVQDFSSSFPLEKSKCTINANHRTMTRYHSKEDEGYRKVVRRLQAPCEKLFREKSREDKMRRLYEERTEEETISSACLNTLYFPEMNYRQMEIRNARTKSCTWILNNEAYIQWAKQKQGVLWIKGKPGSGKSTLMKKIFRLLNNDAEEDSPYCLSYFFHRRGGQLQHCELGMFRTLLHQLFNQQPKLGADLQSLFDENQKLGKFGTAWDWTLTDLRQTFRSALTAAAKIRPFRVFIDALDEGGDESARSIVSYLYDLESDLLEGGSSASICFSCRHYPILARNDGLSICVEDENHDDITLDVSETLQMLLISPDQNSTKDKDIEVLKSTIAQKSSGVFLWATLVTPRIAEQYNEGKPLDIVLNTLKTVPMDIREVYRHILTEVINPQDLSESLHLLQLISLAARPLSILELQFAMAYASTWNSQPEISVPSATGFTQRIISLSGGLAEIKEVVNDDYTTKIVQFIHQSVIDFLIQDRLKCLAPHSAEDLIAQGHSRLSQACIRSLKLGENSGDLPHWLPRLRVMDTSPHNPLIWYAVDQCFFHVQKAEIYGFIETQPQDEFEANAHRYLQLWITIYTHMKGPRAQCPAKSATMLHVAACYNLHSTCRILLEKGVDVEAEDVTGNRSIHYAARYGDRHIGTILLDAGTSVDKRNNSGVDPLEEASLSGNVDLVKLLLGHGAKISETALKNAVERESIACVELLLQHGATINVTGLGHGNVLFLAVRAGNFQIIRRLMDHYRDDTNKEILNELLNAAAGEHNTAIVKLILDHGAVTREQGGWLGSPLLEAILVNKADTVKLLLEHGADANANLRWGYENALGLANRVRSLNIVELLLEYGAEELGPGYHSSRSSTSWETADEGESDEMPSVDIEVSAAAGSGSSILIPGNSRIEAAIGGTKLTFPPRRRMSI
ncbi:hypothetical protein EG329_011550 [Mollisiaceae sp. DMI_Dod_QoI]|nr:hypothetical protein EG329_011550 [Helotiales sp. DMI_Dod_QoI]